MADQQDTPLSDDERAELEALRAEKARRERAELEALRAEQEAVRASKPAAAPTPQAAPKAVPQQPSAPAASRPEPAKQPEPAKPETFGQRMVLSQGEDDDGIPAMPPAQKILIALCLIAALAAGAYVVLNNLGML
ncbi:MULTISPECIES: hypothetical protein [Enorma]|uniref:hypothetical protein n=1 Tax=Enorma TaxID=1472762 RepID=UPI00034601FE|nr:MULTISPECIES: hypothetical protein [Enorma]